MAAALLGYVARTLDAAPATRTIEWAAPPGCPRPEYVTARIVALLGEGSDRSRSIDARARVEREGSVWRVSLTLRDGDAAGTRMLDAESCLAAADATALIVALAIDPSRVAQAESRVASAESTAALDGGAVPDDDARATEDAAPSIAADADLHPARNVASFVPPASPAALGPQVVDQTPAAMDPARIALAAGLVFDDGTLPSPSFGMGGALAWTPHPLRLELAGAYFPTRRSQLDATPTRGGDFSLVAGALRGCYELTSGRVTLAPCGGAELAWMRAQGFGVDVPLGADGVWASVVAGALAEVPLTPTFGVRTQLDGVFPLSRPRFELAGIAPVHSPAFASVRASLSLGARF